MRQFVRTGVLVGATAAVVIGGTLVSYASWMLPAPAATARVAAGAMPSGATPRAEAHGDKAVVTWSAQEIVPGVKVTAYVVTAHDTDQSPLPSIAHAVTASDSAVESITFTAAELAGGKWKWAITPRLGSWTGTEGALSNPPLAFPINAALVVAKAKAATAPPAGRSSEEKASPAMPTTASSSEGPVKKQPSAPEPVESGEPATTQGTEVDPTAAESPSTIDSPAASP